MPRGKGPQKVDKAKRKRVQARAKASRQRIKQSNLAKGMEASAKSYYKKDSNTGKNKIVLSASKGGQKALAPTAIAQTVEDLSKSKVNKESVKDILSRVKDLQAYINQSNLTQFQKNKLREQINWARTNFAKTGYSLGEVMAAIGSGAISDIIQRTPIDRDTAERLGITDDVQFIMDKYGREAVLRPDGSVTAIAPTAGQLFGDMTRGAVNMFGNNLLSRLMTGGKGFNVQAPEFNFGMVPNTSMYATPFDSFQVNQKTGGIESLKPSFNIFSGDRNKPLDSLNRQMSPRNNRPETPAEQGSGSGDGGGGTTPSTFAYVPFARPVAYNYTGGPEQMYLGGGFTQDGVPIGPFRAADGGIANFKGYGY